MSLRSKNFPFRQFVLWCSAASLCFPSSLWGTGGGKNPRQYEDGDETGAPPRRRLRTGNEAQEEAARLYTLANDQGDADAQFNLGRMYEEA